MMRLNESTELRAQYGVGLRRVLALWTIYLLLRAKALDGFQVGGPIGPAPPYRYLGISRASHCFDTYVRRLYLTDSRAESPNRGSNLESTKSQRELVTHKF